MTINELIQVAHADAKAKGWWDEERNVSECLMLIVSECGEALEAHRKGKMGDLQQFDARYPERNCQLSEEASMSLFRNAFEDYIKDSFSDELSDIVIRIADFLGSRGCVCEHEPNDMRRNGNVGGNLFYVVQMISTGTIERIKGAMFEVFGIAEAHDIDLWRHIELRMQYLGAANNR